MFSKNTTLQAMALMLASMACFAAMNIIISSLAGGMHSMQMVFIRNAMSLAMISSFELVRQHGRLHFPTARMSGHFGRAVAGLIAMQLWFHSVTIMPVTLATALSFTTPIFATIFAILFLGERAGIRRWAAMLVSFIGVIMILRPDTQAMDANIVFVLAASAAMAVAGTFVKSLSRTERPETIVFYMVLVMTPLSLPLALFYWQPVSWHQLWLLFFIALFSTVAQLMMARAFKRAEVVVLMPLDFTRLIFTSCLAYVFFGEVLDSHAWFGAAIIVASTLYIAHREAKIKRRAKR
ncbi:MAG: DMT family transporter [Alphaproteobacteria bacterium]|nr:DMT family transporter [Alphaproteobacteria bacterium]